MPGIITAVIPNIQIDISISWDIYAPTPGDVFWSINKVTNSGNAMKKINSINTIIIDFIT